MVFCQGQPWPSGRGKTSGLKKRLTMESKKTKTLIGSTKSSCSLYYSNKAINLAATFNCNTILLIKKI